MRRHLRATLIGCLLAAGLQVTVGAPGAQAGVGARDTSYGTNGEAWADTAPGDTRTIATQVLADGSTVTLAWVDQRLATTPPTVEGRLALVRVSATGVPGAITRTGVAGLGRIDGRPLLAVLGPDGSAVVTVPESSAYRTLVIRLRPDGTLDPRFGTGGRTSLPATDPCCGDRATDLVVHTDGAVSLLQRAGAHTAVVRLTPTGGLDPDFGEAGRVVRTDAKAWGMTTQLAAGPDRSLYVTRGWSAEEGMLPAPVVERWLADGSLDPAFGTAGSLTLPEAAGSVTRQVDGSLSLVLGHSRIAHVRADGSFDPAYGTGGTTPRLLPTTYGTAPIVRIAVRADGTVVATDGQRTGELDPAGAVALPFERRHPKTVALADLDLTSGGFVVSGDAVPGEYTSCCSAAHVGLARVRLDGTTDTAYGADGRVLVAASSGGADAIVGSWVDPQQRLVVVTATSAGWGMTRLLPSGTADPSFGSAGVVRVDTPAPTSVTGTADGGIAAIGRGRGGGYPTERPQTDLVQRFDASGRPVAAFGTAGQVHLDTYDLTGRTAITELPLGRLAVVRNDGLTVLTAAGIPDTTFGGTGTVALPTPTGWSGAALQADAIGILVATTQSAPAAGGAPLETTLRRVLPTGAVDPSYGVGGKVTLPSTGAVDALLPAGAVGTLATYVSHTDGTTHRVLVGGVVDPTFTPIPPTDPHWTGVTTSADALGRVLVVGGHAPGRAVRRYLPTGAVDLAFGDDGQLRIDAGFLIGAHTTNGRIIVVGTAAQDVWTLALHDREPPGIPTVHVRGATVTEGDIAEIRFTLDRPGETAVRFTLRSRDATGRPSDTPSLPERSELHIAAGQTAGVLRVQTREDALYEGTELVEILIVDADQAEVGTASALLTIEDDDRVGDAPGRPNVALTGADEVRVLTDPTRPGASTPTFMTVLVFDGGRLAWYAHINGDHGRVQIPKPRTGSTYQLYAAASNPQGTSPAAGPLEYGNRGPSQPSLPLPKVVHTRGGTLVKWSTEFPGAAALFGPDHLHSPAVIWSVVVTSADGRDVLHASNLPTESRGALLTDLPPDRDVRVLLVGWYHSGPVVSDAVPLRTSSASVVPDLGTTRAPYQLELARRGASPSVMWLHDPLPELDPPIEGFTVTVVRNGKVVSAREYPPNVRNAPLVPSEIRNGATVQVTTRSAAGTAGSEVIPAAWR